MKYISTRGHPKKLSFMEAIQAGIAPDGGLFIPEIFPSLPETWEEDWSDLTFSELATVLLRFFITESEISTPILSELTHQAFSTFRSEQVTPLVTLAPHLHVLELFHGPTFAFKDIALQFLGVLMKKFPPHSSTTTVLGATSGDTGSAAIHAFKDIPHVRVCILYPKNKISEVQEAQMTTVLNETVCNVSADANFDECQ
ncbi:threonine synthase, partial [Coelomomyces lativittatus]